MNKPPPVSPPPPAQARAAKPTASSPPPPAPSADGQMSTRQKLSLADFALHLRDEQLEARVVHYKAHLETSPELDKVTESVVAELQELQRAAGRAPSRPPPVADRAQIEIELIASLKQMLAHVFRAGELSSLIQRKMAEASKRFARLFFESELGERIRGASGEQKTMRFGVEALYHVLARHRGMLVRELESFAYTSPEELVDAKTHLEETIRELRNTFLSATTPELNALVAQLNELYSRFFSAELPPEIGELAWEVVKGARLADGQGDGRVIGYKIGADAFPRFRATFERKFLQRLVAYVEEGMLAHVRGKSTQFRAETLRFVSDPQIFTDVCELVCDAIYDYLYNDGFLDLPEGWLQRIRSA